MAKNKDYTIERYEPNPNQVKEPMLKNRTYQAYRWKEISRLTNWTEKESLNYFKSQNYKGDYRIKETYSSNIILTISSKKSAKT